MPAGDSPDVLVARFLKKNNYLKTFDAFIQETNIDPSTITNEPTDLTIEEILQEKKLYDLALRFSKIDTNAGEADFSVPYPTAPADLTTPSTSSNILSLTLASLVLPISPDIPDLIEQQNVILSTSSDKSLRIYSAESPHSLISTVANLHRGPILSVIPIASKWIITASMTGDIAISSTITGEIKQRWEGHDKYIVKLAISEPVEEEGGSSQEVRYLAAASYDKSVSLHKLLIPLSDFESSHPSIEFLQKQEFDVTVEDVLFTRDYSTSTADQILIVTLRDSPNLHILTPSPSFSTAITTTKLPLNATSTTWLAYTPTSLTPHPQQPHLIALITSALPSPKIMIYDLKKREVYKDFPVPTQLSAYSTGIIVWRADANASGLWVNGDDGIVRGVEVKSGGVKVELKGHGWRKVRCLAAGRISKSAESKDVEEQDDVEEDEEIVISGGFDGGLKVWKVEKAAAV